MVHTYTQIYAQCVPTDQGCVWLSAHLYSSCRSAVCCCLCGALPCLVHTHIHTQFKHTCAHAACPQIVAESGFLSMDDAVLTVTLEPGTPYVLVNEAQGALSSGVVEAALLVFCSALLKRVPGLFFCSLLSGRSRRQCA